MVRHAETSAVGKNATRVRAVGAPTPSPIRASTATRTAGHSRMTVRPAAFPISWMDTMGSHGDRATSLRRIRKLKVRRQNRGASCGPTQRAAPRDGPRSCASLSSTQLPPGRRPSAMDDTVVAGIRLRDSTRPRSPRLGYSCHFPTPTVGSGALSGRCPRMQPRRALRDELLECLRHPACSACGSVCASGRLDCRSPPNCPMDVCA